MRSSAVVFRGIDMVVEAYDANEVAAWAMISGQDVFCAYEGESLEEGKALLEETLRRLHKANCKTAFDLKVYKLKPGQEIEFKTAAFRGFRFQIFGDSDLSPYEYGRQQASAQYDNRFEEMTREITELKAALAKAEEEVEEEKPAGVSAMISGILELPNVKEALSMKLIGLINKVVPIMPQGRPAAIAGVPGRGLQSLLDADQQQKVQQAVNILCAKDAKLGDHLLSVANIAMTNPAQYNMLIGMLK